MSNVNKRVFYCIKTMYVLYADDFIIAGPDQREIHQFIKYPNKAGLDEVVEGIIVIKVRVQWI